MQDATSCARGPWRWPCGGRTRRSSAAAPAAGDATSTAIPGVIAAGQKWTKVWETSGNNADGLVGTPDGGLLIAQNDNAQVMKLDRDGKASVAYKDTNTGGALSFNPKGSLFIVQRGIGTAVWQLAPERKMLANRINGDPLECIGGVINDITADSKGGAYFTMGGLFYADSKGTVTRYGENLRTNGVLLSRDEKTVFVTNGPSVVAFDVQPNGALTNQREFVAFPGGGGDGITIDSEGRIYVTGARVCRWRVRTANTWDDPDAAGRDHRGLQRAGQEDALCGRLHPQGRRP